MKPISTFVESLRPILAAPAARPDPSRCPRCGGDGHVLVDGLLRPCECLRPEIEARRLKGARIPADLEWATLQSICPRTGTQAVALEAVREFVSEVRAGAVRGLLLKGPSACGKSLLAAAALRGLLDRGVSGWFYAAGEIVDDCERDGDPATMRRLLERRVIVLDGLGSERATSFAAERMRQIVLRADQAARVLIVTTHLDGKSVRARYGDHVLSRVLNLQIVKLEGAARGEGEA